MTISRKKNARKFRGFEAPEACIQAVEAAVEKPFEEGLKFERALFEKLVASEQSAAQRYAFFAEREAAKIPDIPKDTPTREIARVGMIGAGTMGGGISMNFLNAGIPVTIVETKQDALDRGLATIRKNYENSAKRGRLSMEDVEKRMALITPSLALDDPGRLRSRDRGGVRTDGGEEGDLHEARRHLQAGRDHGEQHLLSRYRRDRLGHEPARVTCSACISSRRPMSCACSEVVRGEKTEKDVVATAMALGKRIGKVAVCVGVAHGFVGNRMLSERQREANNLIMEGAMPWDVDRVLHEFGLPMGPFAMADLAGLDLGWTPENSTGETAKERLCEIDRRGQKNGKGFYDYDENRKATPSKVTEEIILDLSRAKGITRPRASATRKSWSAASIR